LQLHGEFRRSLESIRVTPLQAGVLLFLRRHPEAKVTDAAAALCVRLPTVSEVVKDLVRKRWVIKRRSATDTRVVHLRLSRQGTALVRRIMDKVRDADHPALQRYTVQHLQGRASSIGERAVPRGPED
jgi:DNA-binding MarR family transcriptional regulator